MGLTGRGVRIQCTLLMPWFGPPFVLPPPKNVPAPKDPFPSPSSTASWCPWLQWSWNGYCWIPWASGNHWKSFALLICVDCSQWQWLFLALHSLLSGHRVEEACVRCAYRQCWSPQDLAPSLHAPTQPKRICVSWHKVQMPSCWASVGLCTGLASCQVAAWGWLHWLKRTLRLYCRCY